MKRPVRLSYPAGIFGHASYVRRLNKYCPYLEKKLKKHKSFEK